MTIYGLGDERGSEQKLGRLVDAAWEEYMKWKLYILDKLSLMMRTCEKGNLLHCSICVYPF